MTRKESDYFKPYNSLMIEANVFLGHDTVNDWFFYMTARTMVEVARHTDYYLEELKWIKEHLYDYVHDLRHRLESYEKYETCAKVATQLAKFDKSINFMHAALNKLDI